MKENEENIKVLTKEEIIALSNIKKRQEFIEGYEKWGAWLEIPQLNVKIYKAILPEGQSMTITEFSNSNIYTTYKSCAYRYSSKDTAYNSYPDSLYILVEKLKELKVKYCGEKNKSKE